MTNKPNGSQAGFSLIEVLIALVLLALGTLALFNLEFRALQNAQLAYSRSVASVIALDASESLWAAQTELGSGEDCLTQSALNDVATALENRWNQADQKLHDFSVTMQEQDSINCAVTIQVSINKSLNVDEEDKIVRFHLTLPKREDLGD